MPHLPHLADRIREKVVEMGGSVRSRAAVLGVSYVTIHRFINNERIPSAGDLERMANALGFSVELVPIP